MAEVRNTILTDRDIKIFMMFGKTIKFAKLEDGKIVLCSDGIFAALFGDNKYGHESKIRKKLSADAEHAESSKNYDFYSLQKYERYFLEYKVQSAAYKNSLIKQDGRYDNYVAFVTDGGVNMLYRKAVSELGEQPDMEFKNIDKEYLTAIESKIEKTEPTKTEQSLTEQLNIEEEVVERIKEAPKVKKKEEQRPDTFLRNMLTNKDVYLWSTVLLVICLTPFTYMALLKYLSIDESGWKMYLSYFMAGGLAVTFDWSILVFTMNGKKKLANIGSIFQTIFISVHFDLIKELIGDTTQTYVTKIFAVVYAAILINQFSELSKTGNEGSKERRQI